MKKEVHPAVSAFVLIFCFAAVGIAWKELSDLPPRPDLSRKASKEAGLKCPPRGEPVAPVNGVWEYGNPDGIVKIEAVLQMAGKKGEPQDGLCTWLQRYVTVHPDYAYAKVYDLDSEAGRAELKRRGLKGPAVYINGKHEFDTRWQGEDRHVDLTTIGENPISRGLLGGLVAEEFVSQYYFEGKPIKTTKGSRGTPQ